MKSVRDESGYNQGWTGGLSTQVRAERRCDLMISKMSPGPSKTILEIGCGRGEIARRLADRTGMNVLGTDRSESFVTEANAQATSSAVHFEVLDFTKPEDILGRRFDYVVGNGILHHLYYSLDASLRAIRELLATDGRILFLEPNLHNPYVYSIFSWPRLRRLAKLEPDEMAFTRRFIVEKLHQAEFGDVEVDYRDFLLPGIPDWLIQPSISVGRVAERVPGLRHMAQSLFISANL
jgi:SAM-dependent methyltransferase